MLFYTKTENKVYMIKLNTPKNSLAKKMSPHYMPAHQATLSLPSVISSLLWETEDLKDLTSVPVMLAIAV